MWQLINIKTKEVAFTGRKYSDCQSFAIKRKLFRIEKSEFFRHILCGDWHIVKQAEMHK